MGGGCRTVGAMVLVCHRIRQYIMKGCYDPSVSQDKTLRQYITEGCYCPSVSLDKTIYSRDPV